jgi:hypothetical protein
MATKRDKADFASAKKEAEAAKRNAPLFEMIPFGSFVKDYVPPSYLIKGMFQKRYIYALTAPTGFGKTAVAILLAMLVALGWPLHGREIKRGRVLYFAGENPDDIRARLIRQAEEFEVEEPDVVIVPKVIDFADKNIKKLLAELSEIHGPFDLVIVDTSAAYFFGSDENGNSQMKDHARTLRALLQLSGEPCVIVLCHPPAYKDAILKVPRGGSAFLAEIDGNTYLERMDNIVTLHRHEKFRGAPWNPMAFELATKRSDKVRDQDGTHIPMVIAAPVDNNQEVARKIAVRSKQDQILALMLVSPGLSQAERARRLGWLGYDGDPKKQDVSRRIAELIKAKLVAEDRDVWKLTAAGAAAAKKLNLAPDQVEMPIETDEPAIDASGVNSRKP